MKLKPRKTHRRIVTGRITSPESRKNAETGKRELLLSYVDDRSNHQHLVTTKDIFLYAAGDNEEGQLPDGLDRLMNHKFVLHLDTNEAVVGLDVIPARTYRSKVIPVSQIGVTTVRFEWMLDGAVCRVTSRPPSTSWEKLIAVIKELDALIAKGTAITASTKLGSLGRVTSVDGDAIEFKMSTGKTGGQPVFDVPTDDDED